MLLFMLLLPLFMLLLSIVIRVKTTTLTIWRMIPVNDPNKKLSGRCTRCC
jgi:hypothetical protein